MSNASHRALAISLLIAVGAAAAQDAPISQPAVWAEKPDAAAFERIENERLAAAQHAVELLAVTGGARTIDNTLVPYDEAIRQLDAATDFAFVMQQVHPDAAFRDRATAMLAKASAAATALSLNQQAYRAMASLNVAAADAATRYYVQRQLLEFRLAGVSKDAQTRAKLAALEDRLTKDQSTFERNISDDSRTLELTDASELDGLPQDYIENHKPGADGRIRVTTNYPDLFPILDYARSDALRRRLWTAWSERAYPINRKVLQDMMQTRYEIASLLGYASWADYNAADKMIGTRANIAQFIGQLYTSTRPMSQREFAMLLAEKRKTDPDASSIMTYENYRLSELVRRSQYDFDSQSVRPYLPYKAVKQGVLDTAATLFHISFRQESDASAWDPAVETWDVLQDEKMIGRFYLDMHPRPGKYSHAQMAPLLDGIRGKQLPEAVLICNLPAPTATDPGLNDYEDVVTFFHEFGHLMHHILGGQQRWAGISGISMETDFIEAPSQMLEEWMRSPQVLASFARHYQSGEPIPAELVARMNHASAFGRAGKWARQNALAALSFDIYKAPPRQVELDAVAMRDFRRYTMMMPLASDAHMYASFTHLGGYSSAYYTYVLDKVIAEDFFQQFDRANLLGGEMPMRYRHLVLEPGGSMSANDLVKNFLGRPQNLAAFQQWMGEEFVAQPLAGSGATGNSID